MDEPAHYTAFEGDDRIAAGSLDAVIRAAAARTQAGLVLVFDDATGRTVDVDTRRPPVEHAPAPESDARRGPGRPKLGVVAREVTLLPRHWEWLAAQPGGASVALRKLVETARKAEDGKGRVRQVQDAAYRFMYAMAGDRPGYEEALRALYAPDGARFQSLTEAWPANVRDHARILAQPVFDL
jgi:hypothetical protein